MFIDNLQKLVLDISMYFQCLLTPVNLHLPLMEKFISVMFLFYLSIIPSNPKPILIIFSKCFVIINYSQMSVNIKLYAYRNYKQHLTLLQGRGFQFPSVDSTHLHISTLSFTALHLTIKISKTAMVIQCSIKKRYLVMSNHA